MQRAVTYQNELRNYQEIGVCLRMRNLDQYKYNIFSEGYAKAGCEFHYHRAMTLANYNNSVSGLAFWKKLNAIEELIAKRNMIDNQRAFDRKDIEKIQKITHDLQALIAGFEEDEHAYNELLKKYQHHQQNISTCYQECTKKCTWWMSELLTMVGDEIGDWSKKPSANESYILDAHSMQTVLAQVSESQLYQNTQSGNDMWLKYFDHQNILDFCTIRIWVVLLQRWSDHIGVQNHGKQKMDDAKVLKQLRVIAGKYYMEKNDPIIDEMIRYASADYYRDMAASYQVVPLDSAYIEQLVGQLDEMYQHSLNIAFLEAVDSDKEGTV